MGEEGCCLSFRTEERQMMVRRLPGSPLRQNARDKTTEGFLRFPGSGASRSLRCCRCLLAVPLAVPPRWMMALSLGVLLLGVAPNTWARTWRVEKDGSGDTTIIQAALNLCAPGDTVLVGPGRYTYHAPFNFGALTEDTYVVVDTPDVTLRGVDRDAVIIGPDTYTQIGAYEPNGIATSKAATGLKLENLTVENVVEGITFLVAADATDCVVRNCETGIVVITDTDHTFTRCEVHDSPGWSLACYLQNTRVVVAQCLFEAYVPFPGAQSPGGVNISAAQNVLVTGCTFKGDTYLQFQMFTDGVIQNCTIDRGGMAILDSNADLVGNVFGRTPLTNVQFMGGGSLTATGNIFGGGEDATLYFFGNSVVMHDNHILNAGSYSVMLGGYDSTNYTLDLRNNWWGTADSTQIATWIRDVNDNPWFGMEVRFVPFADQPLPAKTTSFGGLKAGFGGK